MNSHFLKFVTGSIILSAILAGVASASPPSDPPAAPPDNDFVSHIAQSAAHYREVQESLKSKDEGTRAEALESALKDPDSAIRVLAVSTYLKRFHELTPEIVLETGASLNQEDVPQLGITNITWSDDAKSFTGFVAVRCNGPVGVNGQLSGGKLTLHYDALCLPPNYVSKDSESTKAGSNVLPVACTAILSLDDQAHELDGPLRCLSVPTKARVRLPFGD
jgi:hypothetical protein